MATDAELLAVGIPTRAEITAAHEVWKVANPTDRRIGWDIEPDGSRIYSTYVGNQVVYGTVEFVTAALSGSD